MPYNFYRFRVMLKMDNGQSVLNAKHIFQPLTVYTAAWKKWPIDICQKQNKTVNIAWIYTIWNISKFLYSSKNIPDFYNSWQCMLRNWKYSPIFSWIATIEQLLFSSIFYKMLIKNKGIQHFGELAVYL